MMCVFVNEIENHLTDPFESVLFIESVHSQTAWTVRLWIIILFSLNKSYPTEPKSVCWGDAL